jgi:hypothetical protein
MRLSRIAISIALLAATPAAAKPFPWGPRDKPPAVAGISLRDSEQHALDVLGPPDEATQTAAGEVLEYAARGLEVTATPQGVSAIRLRTPDAGEIGGIRVGNPARDVILKWGVPRGGEGRTAIFGNGEWTISVTLHEKYSTVVELTLASAGAPKPPPQQSDLNVFKTR